MHATLRSANKALADYYSNGQFLKDLNSDKQHWQQLQELAAGFVVEKDVIQKYCQAAAIIRFTFGNLDFQADGVALRPAGELVEFELDGNVVPAWHRDHFIHSVYVFLLGFYLLFNLRLETCYGLKAIRELYYSWGIDDTDTSKLENALRSGKVDHSQCEIGPNKQAYPRTFAQFVYQWIWASLSHDWGYPFSYDRISREHFLSELTSFLGNLLPPEEKEKWLKDPTDLLLAWDTLFETFKVLLPKSITGQAEFAGLTTPTRIWAHRLQMISDENKDWWVHLITHLSWAAFTPDAQREHGSTGSIIYLFLTFLTRFLQTPTSDNEALNVFVDYKFFLHEGEVVAAVLCHDVFFDHLKRIALEGSPITYLLVLCDELQDFGRPQPLTLEAANYESTLDTVEIGLASPAGLIFTFQPTTGEAEDSAKERQAKCLKRLQKLNPCPVRDEASCF